jgi:hypothetical protein
MVLVELMNRPQRGGDDGPQFAPNWRQKLWLRFLRWLREHIPLPGMIVNFAPRQTRYNQDESTLSKSARKS